MIVTLESPRLLLRPFRTDDFGRYAAICADHEVMRYIGEGTPLTRSRVEVSGMEALVYGITRGEFGRKQP